MILKMVMCHPKGWSLLLIPWYTWYQKKMFNFDTWYLYIRVQFFYTLCTPGGANPPAFIVGCTPQNKVHPSMHNFSFNSTSFVPCSHRSAQPKAQSKVSTWQWGLARLTWQVLSHCNGPIAAYDPLMVCMTLYDSSSSFSVDEDAESLDRWCHSLNWSAGVRFSSPGTRAFNFPWVEEALFLNLILNSACRVWTPIDSDTVNSNTKVCNNMIEENRRKSKNPCGF